MLKTVGMYLKRTKKLKEPTDLYSHKVGLLEGGELDLESLRGKPTLIVAQAFVGVYGGYFGGGVGLITTAIYGLLAHVSPRAMFAPRLLMLGLANFAAAIVFAAAWATWRVVHKLGRRLPAHQMVNRFVLARTCALVGAVVVVLADFLASELIPGVRLPTGILTGAAGAPLMLALLIRSRSRL